MNAAMHALSLYLDTSVIGGFNAVNLLQGYPSLRIVAPTFLIHGHDQEKDL